MFETPPVDDVPPDPCTPPDPPAPPKLASTPPAPLVPPFDDTPPEPVLPPLAVPALPPEDDPASRPGAFGKALEFGSTSAGSAQNPPTAQTCGATQSRSRWHSFRHLPSLPHTSEPTQSESYVQPVSSESWQMVPSSDFTQRVPAGQSRVVTHAEWQSPDEQTSPAAQSLFSVQAAARPTPVESVLHPWSSAARRTPTTIVTVYRVRTPPSLPRISPTHNRVPGEGLEDGARRLFDCHDDRGDVVFSASSVREVDEAAHGVIAAGRNVGRNFLRSQIAV